jgi:hypothetical protein
MNALSDEELIEQWRTLGTDVDISDQEAVNGMLQQRNAMVQTMKTRNLFPQKDMNEMEGDAGLYPATDDPLFLQKLLRKQEFAENKQMSVAESIRRGIDPCKGSRGFELSPTQRFVGQFLSPKTPYMSALLYHGVGVGKTCSAITVAEGYLEMYPRKQVIIIAPRNIQPNFSREIFSETKLQLGEDDEPNQYLGCTENTYLKLTGTEYSREKASILNRVNHLKARRYQLVGYLAFYNYIKDILDREISKSLKGERRAQEVHRVLSKRFSNRLIIIDEAHNVRDLTETSDDTADAPGGKAELSESLAGKRLTPYLKQLLEAAQGTKLLLLTATPMYNSYKEIIPLLNLLLINDKKAPVSEADFFNTDGTFLEGGEAKFGMYIQAYVSFMRGENPLAFPLRLEPTGVPRVTTWPARDPLGNDIDNDDLRSQIVNLPFVKTQHSAQGLADYRAVVSRLIATAGLRLAASDGMVQAGNFIFPSSVGGAPETRIREQGFKGAFAEIRESKQFRLNPGVSPTWLHESELGNYSPKSAEIIKRLRTSTGVSFVYCRFVFSGALSVALALEANGYENASKPSGYLKDAVLSPGGKQCARCPKKQAEHGSADHPFKQAKYVLLTGRDDLTPNNKESIELATAFDNKDGFNVKVVVGSQVASEGIDLKFIREVMVFDSWYHLNKLEQVIGRGIRFCSHSALEKEKRNCTVSLLLSTFPDAQNQETIEMYQYRMGFEKAFQIGTITRVMKRYAVDCNLNRDAVLIQGLDPIDVEDSQGETRYGVEINDVPYTSVCDWIDTCDYRCAVEVDINPLEADESTYDEYAARWRVYQIKQRLRKLFERQPFYRFDDLQHDLVDIPRVAIAAIMSDIVGNRSFRIQVRDETGYIIYKNGFYLFQPDKIRDTGIPLALRAALFPVKQDSYEEFEEVAVARPTALAEPAAAQRNVAAPQAVVQQTEAEPVDEVRGDIAAFWSAMETFFETIQEGTLAPAKSDKEILPKSVELALRNRYTTTTLNKRVYDKAYNTISMVCRFYTDIKANEGWREMLTYAAAKFVWDEILNIEEQYALYKAKKDDPSLLLSIVWEDHILTYDEEVIYRRVNPATGKLEYKCGDGDCSAALVTAIETDEESTDGMRSLRANTATTGNPYGTMNYKNGLFVFKTNKPVAPSTSGAYEKQERGSECANVPNMPPHYALLEEIGRIAQGTLGTNLGFVQSELQEAQAPRSVKNSTRACALTEIALRFFDELKLQEKRWFYRPLPTFYTKHPGILRKKAA